MYEIRPCAVEGCEQTAVLGENTCYSHLSDPHAYVEALMTRLQADGALYDADVSGVEFRNVDFSGIGLYGCRFSGATFDHCTMSRGSVDLCSFDHARFSDCSMTEANMRNSVFGGAILTNCDYSGSDIVQCSWNAAVCTTVLFDDTDLLHSRFIGAELVDTSFRNCNLKAVQFQHSIRIRGSFKYSNDEEAIFDAEGIL